MTKYHINPDTGRPNQCTAKVKCRFGESTEHFDTKEEARAGYEKQMQSKTVSPSLKKPTQVPAVSHYSMSAADVSATSDELMSLSNGAVSLHLSDYDDSGQELILNFNRQDEINMMIETQPNGKHLGYVGYGPDYRSIRQSLDRLLTPSKIDELGSLNSDYPKVSPNGDSTEAAKKITQSIDRLINGKTDAAKRAKVSPEKPVKSKLPIIPGVPPVSTDRELDTEQNELHYELYGYTVKRLLETRGIGLKEIEEEERSGEYRVDTKVPSYYEIEFSTDLARRELGLPARSKTGIDQDELRVAQIKKDEADAKRFGWFTDSESRKKVEDNYKAAKAEFDQILEARRSKVAKR